MQEGQLPLAQYGQAPFLFPGPQSDSSLAVMGTPSVPAPGVAPLDTNASLDAEQQQTCLQYGTVLAGGEIPYFLSLVMSPIT